MIQKKPKAVNAKKHPVGIVVYSTGQTKTGEWFAVARFEPLDSTTTAPEPIMVGPFETLAEARRVGLPCLKEAISDACATLGMPLLKEAMAMGGGAKS